LFFGEKIRSNIVIGKLGNTALGIKEGKELKPTKKGGEGTRESERGISTGNEIYPKTSEK